MLFSATLPKWVKKLVKQYLNSECIVLPYAVLAG